MRISLNAHLISSSGSFIIFIQIKSLYMYQVVLKYVYFPRRWISYASFHSTNSRSTGPHQANLVLSAYASSIRAVSPELPLLAHTSSESRGTFRQKARSLAPLNDWACAVKIWHDGMLEDTNSLDGAQLWFVLLCFTLIPTGIQHSFTLYTSEAEKSKESLQ